MHVRLIPHSPSGPRHLLAHYPLVSCILALLAIYTDARAYRPSASLLAFLAGRVWTRLLLLVLLLLVLLLLLRSRCRRRSSR